MGYSHVYKLLQGDTGDLEQATGSGRGVCQFPWSLGMIAASPYMCAKLEAWFLGSSFRSLQMDPFRERLGDGQSCLLSLHLILGG